MRRREKGLGDEAKSRQTVGVVDRIEDGDWAVVHIGEDESFSLDLPVSLLPAGTEAGSRLVIQISRDDEATGAARDRISDLQERLEKRSGSAGQKNFKL
jgi:hypothetical protein